RAVPPIPVPSAGLQVGENRVPHAGQMLETARIDQALHRYRCGQAREKIETSGLPAGGLRQGSHEGMADEFDERVASGEGFELHRGFVVTWRPSHWQVEAGQRSLAVLEGAEPSIADGYDDFGCIWVNPCQARRWPPEVICFCGPEAHLGITVAPGE